MEEGAKHSPCSPGAHSWTVGPGKAGLATSPGSVDVLDMAMQGTQRDVGRGQRKARGYGGGG